MLFLLVTCRTVKIHPEVYSITGYIFPALHSLSMALCICMCLRACVPQVASSVITVKYNYPNFVPIQ